MALARIVTVGCLVGMAAATPIELNPFTPGGDDLELGEQHPALGRAVNKRSMSLKAMLPTPESMGKEEDPEESAGMLTNVTKPPARALSWRGESREMNSNVTSKDIANLETFFNTKMVVNYQDLTKFSTGATASPPWPSSYWPIYADGINYVWNKEDTMPPSEKYARAYGLDVKNFTTKISEVNGIIAMNTRQECTTEDDCKELKDGSGCGKLPGETKGFCIPKWFGICHAWAPAAIMEREPRCTVTKNNVTFQPMDIKALITQTYDGSHLSTVFTGTRFNGADEPLNLDDDGRFVDATRRDLGPGFFHIAILNIMGIHKHGFVVDVTAGAEVWNQPVRSYEVISSTEMTPAAAAQTFFNKTEYGFNKEAAKIVFVQVKFSWMVESNENGPMIPDYVDKYTQFAYYEYVLELDADGDIIGGEWVRESKKEHPDFLWFPKSQPEMTLVTDVGLKYREVRELLDASADCEEIPTDDTYPISTPTPSPAPAVTPSQSQSASPAPAATTPAPTTKTPEGSAGGDADAGEDDDDDESGSDATPSPTTPKPTSGDKPTPVPSVSVEPKPVPPPAPVPSPVPSGTPSKGTVVPVVPAPAKTPAPTPAADADDEDEDDTSAGEATATPAPSKKPSKCTVLL